MNLLAGYGLLLLSFVLAGFSAKLTAARRGRRAVEEEDAMRGLILVNRLLRMDFSQDALRSSRRQLRDLFFHFEPGSIAAAPFT